jgi:hypothetical protein
MNLVGDDVGRVDVHDDLQVDAAGRLGGAGVDFQESVCIGRNLRAIFNQGQLLSLQIWV